ncbi:MIF2 [Sanghuangporus sanghuang]
MSKARKSNIDGTHRPLKAHIPYRADDFTHGKKTGINVREVDRRSDGFEKFDDVLTQADAFTPPHLRGRRRANRSLSPPDEEEDDEDGEMDMEIDDTMITSVGAESPGVYFNNAPRPSAPTSANRSAANSGSRSSYIDFDRIPSPRPSPSSQRTRSQPNGSGAMTPTPRPKSNLSKQAVIPSSPEDDESDNEPFQDGSGGDDLNYDFGGGDMDFDNDIPAPESSSPVAARTSFTEIAQEDTDPPQVDDIRISSPPRRVEKRKGKGKESVAEDEMALEEEIAQGLAEVEQEAAEEAEANTTNNKKKSKGQKKRTRDEAQRPKEKKQTVKRKRIQEEDVEPGHEMLNGVRRGTRARFKPLEWWRLEKFVYGRRDSGQSVVPVIKEVIRIPKEVSQSLGQKRHRSKPRSRSKTVQEVDDEDVVVFNPEEGWDDQTDPHGVVLDFATAQEVQRRLAFTAKMLTPRAAADDAFLYQKVFGDGEFIAAGQLILPVGGKKPSKGTKDNTYIFYIIEGAINLKVHRTSFVLATGAMFLVPRGNNYYMENVSQRPAKLFFAQARKVSTDDEPPQEIVHAPPPGTGAAGRTMSVDPAGPRHLSGKGGSLQRSSSLAAAASADRLNLGDKRSAKRAVSK